MNPSSCSDEMLIQGVVNGRSRDFDILAQRYQGRMEGFITKYFRSDAHTADLVQEVFITAFLDLPRLRDRARFKSWLYGIAYRKCLHVSRQARVETKVLQQSTAGRPETAPSVEECVAAEEPTGVSLRLLDRLAPMDSLFIWLHYIEELPYQEVAQLTDLNEATIRQRCRRALQELREVVT